MGSIPRKRQPITLQADLLEHPAVKAWRQIQPEGIRFNEITILKGGKSSVCRIPGVGKNGSAVIGKRSSHADAWIERTVYEEVLPHLPVAALHFYGYLEEPDGQFCWLFIQDADGVLFSDLSEEHLEIAARWLAVLHTSSAKIPAPPDMPDRGSHYYLNLLRLAREIFQKSSPALNLPEQQIEMLTSILSQFHFLESWWDQIEKLCERVPRTLVHEDLKDKHVRVRKSETGHDLLAFDWGHAGWGVPAVDFKLFFTQNAWASRPLAVYWSVAHESWPHLTITDIERLAKLGRIFRSIAAIYWESLDFMSDRPIDQAMKNLRRSYQPRLSSAIQEANVESWNL